MYELKTVTYPNVDSKSVPSSFHPTRVAHLDCPKSRNVGEDQTFKTQRTVGSYGSLSALAPGRTETSTYRSACLQFLLTEG